MYVGCDYHNSEIQVCGLDKEAHPPVHRSVVNQWHEIVATVGHGVEVRAAIIRFDRFRQVKQLALLRPLIPQHLQWPTPGHPRTH